MNITPLRNNIIITKVDNDLTTDAGIVLTRSDEADKAKVVAIGPEITEVKVDDILLVNWNKAPKVRDNFYKINIEDVIAVFED